MGQFGCDAGFSGWSRWRLLKVLCTIHGGSELSGRSNYDGFSRWPGRQLFTVLPSVHATRWARWARWARPGRLLSLLLAIHATGRQSWCWWPRLQQIHAAGRARRARPRRQLLALLLSVHAAGWAWPGSARPGWRLLTLLLSVHASGWSKQPRQERWLLAVHAAEWRSAASSE